MEKILLQRIFFNDGNMIRLRYASFGQVPTLCTPFIKKENRIFYVSPLISDRTIEIIEAEIDILNWVTKKGMIVASPVKSKNGNFVETVVMDEGTFHAVVFTALQGTQLEIEDLNNAQFQEWGATLGKLHTVTQTYQGSGVSKRKTWKEYVEWMRTSLSKDELTIRSELEQIASSLNKLPMTQNNYGLIHFDFELDNLCWQEQTIGMLDFDDCLYMWYVADIAFALRDLFKESVELQNINFLAFVRGYREQYLLDDALLSYLPLFIRFAKLLEYTKLVRSVDIPDSVAYPEWLRGLRLKLTNIMNAYKISLKTHI